MEKTCGNCDSWRPVRLERGYCIFDNLLEDGCAKMHLRDDAACNRHTDIPLTLEQRYQQLAEVARDMLDDLEDLPSGADDYRKKLEELGVEL